MTAIRGWEPTFSADDPDQERLAIQFSSEMCGDRRPDAVNILEMAQALYEAEREGCRPVDGLVYQIDLAAVGLGDREWWKVAEKAVDGIKWETEAELKAARLGAIRAINTIRASFEQVKGAR